MAGLEDIPKKPSDEEDKKGSSGYGTFYLYLLGGLLVLFFVLPTLTRGPTRTPGPTSTPGPTPPPTSTPLPTPTFEEWKESAEEIPYRTLFRYAEQNVGKRVFYRGEVVQVIEDQGDFQLRVNVTPGDYGFWSDTVFLRDVDAPVRILEGDIIAFVGRMNGTFTYETVMGGKVTIPDITVVSLIIESE